MGHKKVGSRAWQQEQRAQQKTEHPEQVMSMEQKQIRQRARRKATKHQRLAQSELEKLYKPLEEWDLEELARGRPRSADGRFTGAPPKYISREVHEKAMEKFRDMVKGQMQVHTVSALKLLGKIIDEDEVDNRGRPLVSASTKLEAVKFLLEHVVGKPKQPVEADISVKLAGILGHALVNPTDGTSFVGFEPASPSARRVLMPGEETPNGHYGAHGGVVDEEVVDDE